MPPRHAYWTIIVDGVPTAFRAALPDDLTATFNRLKEKHASAEMKWFQAGRLWESKDEAHVKLREGYRVGKDGALIPPDGRERRDYSWRPGGTHEDPREKYAKAKKAKWDRFKKAIRDRSEGRRPELEGTGERAPGDKPAWKPKSAPSGDRKAFTPSGAGRAPAKSSGWKPKGAPTGNSAPWRPNDPNSRAPWKPESSAGPARSRSDRSGAKPAWQPKGTGSGDRPAFTPSGAGRGPAKSSGWKPKGAPTGARGPSGPRVPGERAPWKPRGTVPGERAPFTPSAAGRAPAKSSGWKPKGPPSGERAPFTPSGAGRGPATSSGWRPKGPPSGAGRRPAKSSGWAPKGAVPGARAPWKPKGPPAGPGRRPAKGAWKPKGPGGPPQKPPPARRNKRDDD